MKWYLKYLSLMIVSTCALGTIIVDHHMKPQANTSVDFKAPQPVIQSTSVPLLDLSPLKAEVEALSELIKQMQSEDEATFKAIATQITSELQIKLDTVHDSISSLEDKQHPVKILPDTALPFQVISIDSLQYVSVATVAYGFKTTALEQGDALAGWQVESIDFAKQQIVFANDEGEVHINLNHGETHA